MQMNNFGWFVFQELIYVVEWYYGFRIGDLFKSLG